MRFEVLQQRLYRGKTGLYGYSDDMKMGSCVWSSQVLPDCSAKMVCCARSSQVLPDCSAKMVCCAQSSQVLPDCSAKMVSCVRSHPHPFFNWLLNPALMRKEVLRATADRLVVCPLS